MVKIGITGAGGNVGTQARKGLDTHDVRPIYFDDDSSRDGPVCDIRNREAVMETLDGLDVVVHLAANPSPSASWSDCRDTNIEGTKHVYDAAVATDVERVIFATTNHVTEMYNRPTAERPEPRDPPRPIAPDDPPRPDSYYAISKVTGEMLGAYHADVDGIEVVNLRIGWLLTEDELREKAARSGRDGYYARAMWLSPRDCQQAIRQAVEVTLPHNPITVNLTSHNSDRYLSLTQAMRWLDYRPEDNSASVNIDP